METNQKVLFNLAGTNYLLELEGDILKVKRMYDRKVLDTFHVDEDPMDMVVDEIVMDFIEWCPAPISTDQEVLTMTDQVYVVVTMFYALRTMAIVKEVK